MPRSLVDLLQVLSVKVRQEVTVSASIVLVGILTAIGCMILIVLMWSFFGTLMIAGGVVLLVVKVFGFLLLARTYGTADSGTNMAIRHHSDIREDV